MDFANFWFQDAASGPNPGLIGNGLRFRGSQYLSRSFSGSSSGQGQVWTLSMWLKDSVENTDRCPFAAGNGGEFYNGMTFMAGNSLGIWTYVKNNGQRPMFECGDRFRDPGGWFHFVVRTETTNSNGALRDRFYINGREYTNFPTWRNESSQNQGLPWMGSTATHYVGSNYNGQQPWRGYMAEVHCCDGQSLGPENFGEYDENGVWVPIIPSGLTYGNWGFHLDFSDPANIGADRSGRGNNWTANGFELSNTNSRNYDSVLDSPTNNSLTLNPLIDVGDANLSDANTRAQDGSSGGGWISRGSTMELPLSGKVYWEMELGGGTTNCFIGMINRDKVGNFQPAQDQGNTFSVRQSDCDPRPSGATITGPRESMGYNDIIGFAADCDTGILRIYKNNVLNVEYVTKFDPNLHYTPAFFSSGAGTQTHAFKFSNLAYDPPAGFVPLQAAAHPKVAITNPKEHFNTVLYTGNGGTQSITGLDFSPDLVWIKNRTSARSHNWFDTVRGTGKTIYSNLTDQESTNQSGGYLTSFDANGFTVQNGSSSDVNWNGDNYVAWCWNKSSEAGFHVEQYTGNGSADRTVNHSAGFTPEFVLVKGLDGNFNWLAWTPDLNTNENLLFNGDNADFTPAHGYIRTASSTTLTLIRGGSSNSDINQSGGRYIMYMWRSIPGYSDIGYFTGNGNNNGPFVYTGFRPALVLLKTRDTTGNWVMHDCKRDTYNPTDDQARPNRNDFSSGFNIDLVSNGFKIRTQDIVYNHNNGRMIYMAFAEHPFGGKNVFPSPAR